MLPQALIRQKRDGEALDASELREFIAGVVDGSIPDYQVSAMLMAIFFRGLSAPEMAAWTDAMLHSGDVIDLSEIDRPKVDKHSTGGVGDKISLPLAAAVAACGAAVPMVSGRGLGHTGGTLDKLESIPGFRVDLDTDQFRAQVGRLGLCLIGQTRDIAPADKRLYALRDVTATVESIPLIASSIMSKKLAEGIDALVLDCKVGHGAFMKSLDDAGALADAIRAIGREAGKSVTALITDMETPIGRYVGNALEVAESIATLRGEGPPDTRELTVRLGAEMLLLAGLESGDDTARAAVEGALDSGRAAETFRLMVAAQGGDANVVDAPDEVLPAAAHRQAIVATRSGYVSVMPARDIGVAALLLGAGRRRTEDSVDPAVGIEIAAPVATRVEKGDPVVFLHHNGKGVDEAEERVLRGLTIADEAPSAGSRILEVRR